MAEATKNLPGVRFSTCPGPQACIRDYLAFIGYLVEEIKAGAIARGLSLEGDILPSRHLIDCLADYRLLLAGRGVWSPRGLVYIDFDERAHGGFAYLNPSGPAPFEFLEKLVPVYCRLCLLTAKHNEARENAETLAAELQVRHPNGGASFKIRALEYVAANLAVCLPAEFGVVLRSPDVTGTCKIAVELLWIHLTLVYAGHLKLLAFNLEEFFSRPEPVSALCPLELRSAPFVHGHEHKPRLRYKARGRRIPRARGCPILLSGPKRRSARPKGTRLYESRTSRLCWLTGLWCLDSEMHRRALRWLSRPEPYRGQTDHS